MAGGLQQDGPQQANRPRPAQGARTDGRLGIVIARPFGIPVFISPYWFLVAAVLVVLYSRSGALPVKVNGSVERYLIAIAFVVLLYLSVLIHELSHSLVARGFQLPVRRILLYPLGGYSEIEQEPPTPAKEFLVSAAGPAMSLVLAAIGFGVNEALNPQGIPRALIDGLVLANAVIGVFNLLPGLPLDGGRVLRAVLWKLTGKSGQATVLAAWAGRAIALALAAIVLTQPNGPFGLVNGGYGIWLVAVAAFMWMSAGQALRSAKVRERLPALQARTLARRAIPIPSSLPLAEAIRRADLAQARALVVVDHDSKPIAIVNEGAVIATPEQRRPWIDAGSLARTLDPDMILSADLSGMDLIEAVRRAPASEYLLVEPSSGQVYGVLATADLDHAFAGTRA
ncbi:MAG TPA: site-2 protease family protein [Streptosporangiaceae bacterium]|nr:site-2 protease family protein [Streptosporangiaceae bacterium]